ncbi:MAG: zinc-finger domain-containing protein [Azoarcus sp.]|jgi:uncharacterized Zn-finger protein|nr:zinc-finger domain-containing protein [Azoarcus sp.]
MAESESARTALTVSARDLPLTCPRPDTPPGARHPRVFLDVLRDGQAICPYCGARYVFTGERPQGHH